MLDYNKPNAFYRYITSNYEPLLFWALQNILLEISNFLTNKYEHFKIQMDLFIHSA